jgi:cytochrome c556
MSISKASVALAACLCVGGLGQAQEPSRAEQLIKYRQAIYRVLNGNFGPMAAMATGKAPYEAKEFAMRADRVAFLAAMLDEAYPLESRSGATTRVKPEIWANRAEFDRLLDDMQTNTAQLAKLAEAGDQAAVKSAFAATGRTCKACHDKFRTD